jgi:hypothetical protein
MPTLSANQETINLVFSDAYNLAESWRQRFIHFLEFFHPKNCISLEERRLARRRKGFGQLKFQFDATAHGPGRLEELNSP